MELFPRLKRTVTVGAPYRQAFILRQVGKLHLLPLEVDRREPVHLKLRANPLYLRGVPLVAAHRHHTRLGALLRAVREIGGLVLPQHGRERRHHRYLPRRHGDIFLRLDGSFKRNPVISHHILHRASRVTLDRNPPVVGGVVALLLRVLVVGYAQPRLALGAVAHARAVAIVGKLYPCVVAQPLLTVLAAQGHSVAPCRAPVIGDAYPFVGTLHARVPCRAVGGVLCFQRRRQYDAVLDHLQYLTEGNLHVLTQQGYRYEHPPVKVGGCGKVLYLHIVMRQVLWFSSLPRPRCATRAARTSPSGLPRPSPRHSRVRRADAPPIPA